MTRLTSPRPALGRGRRRSGTALLALAAAATLGARPAPPASAPATRHPAQSVELFLTATTDVHGRLRGWDYFADEPDTQRGLSRAATIVDSVRAAHPGGVLLVDAGDLLQGTPLTYVAARVQPFAVHPVIAAMNAMRYDAAAIGNHEFNYGIGVLDSAVAKATFPFLAANAYRPNGARAYPAFRVVERQGVKVGIVGATTPGSLVWDRDNLAGRLALRDVVPEVAKAVAEARAAGADVVVAVLHSGLGGRPSYDTATTGVPPENVASRVAREVPGIDAMIIGHTHNEIADTTIGTTLVVQPKNWAASVAVARLAVERRGGRWTVTAKHGQLIPSAGRAESPAVLAATDDAHRRTVAYANSEVGRTDVAWRADSGRVVDTPLTDFVLEVQRRRAGAQLAAGAVFSLDASIDPGPITLSEVARLYPYENTLRAIKVSGAQLRAFLEYSARYYRTLAPGADPSAIVDRSVAGYNFDVLVGADYALDLSRPLWQRVTRLAVGGRPVADTDSFTLALNNYRQTGGGGFAMLAGAPVVYDEQEEIRQLLIDEVRRRGTLRPQDYFARNWELLPASVVAAAYAAQHAQPEHDQRRAATTAGPAAAPAARTSSAPAAVGAAPVTPAAATQPRVSKEPTAPVRGAPARGGRATRLRVIGTNDFHGAIEARKGADGSWRGGALAMAREIERARAECRAPECVSVLVDGGDMFQGSVASNMFFGQPVVELYRALRYDAVALGNHEFDWGVDTLRARMREAPFPVLGANVRYTDGRDVAWVPNDTVIRRGGLRIGIVGVADPATPRSSKPANIKGLRFDAMAPVVDSIIRRMRAGGVDAVVVLAHAGAYCNGAKDDDERAPASFDACSGDIVAMAQAMTEHADAIVSGHTHSWVRTVVNGMPIGQARSRGYVVGVIDVPLGGAAAGATTASATIEIRDAIPDSTQKAPPAVEALVRRTLAEVRTRTSSPVATIGEGMPREGDQYAIGNLIADAQRWAGRGDVAVMNNGGIRAGLNAGVATYGSLFDIQPFGNALVRLRIRGSDLRAYLERLVARERLNAHVSGVVVTFDPTRAAGERIASATLSDGKPIDDTALYTLVLNDFLVGGGDGLGLAQRAASMEDTNVKDLDALIGYLKQLPSPVRAPAEMRLRAIQPREISR